MVSACYEHLIYFIEITFRQKNCFVSFVADLFSVPIIFEVKSWEFFVFGRSKMVNI